MKFHKKTTMHRSRVYHYSSSLLTHTELIIYSAKRNCSWVKKIVMYVLTYTILNTHEISTPIPIAWLYTKTHSICLKFLSVLCRLHPRTHKQIQIVRNAHSVISFSSTMCTLQVYKNLYFNKNCILRSRAF